MKWLSTTPTLIIYLLISITSAGTLGSSSVKKFPELGEEEVLTFKAPNLPKQGVWNPYYFYENNERPTSKKYTFWNDVDVHLVEWPGNITRRDPEWPLLKWSKRRAKLVVNRCCEWLTGIEMRAYAYQYLYLTWGKWRFTETFAPPLTIPASLIRNNTIRPGLENTFSRTEILVADFAFVHDALLLALEKDGLLVRVYGLEMAYGTYSDGPLEALKYEISKGIETPVNKIVTQFCCSKHESGTCPFGETVVAYREYSSNFEIYISTNSGKNFNVMFPSTLGFEGLLHAVLPFPDAGKVIVLHGTKSKVYIDSLAQAPSKPDMKELYAIATTLVRMNNLSITGQLQASRIGEEASLIIWDNCFVWYSPDKGHNLTMATFYVHRRMSGNADQTHEIRRKYCKFGELSQLTFSETGKVVLLDSENRFHLGLDTKENWMQLVTLGKDFSLLLKKHRLSITPHFEKESPKMWYPPRFLELPRDLVVQNYDARLGIRLLPRTLFPSQYIPVFFPERVGHLFPQTYKGLLLNPCQTSSLYLNGSISQKPRYFVLRKDSFSILNFTIRFTSRENCTDQLHWEPKDTGRYLNISSSLSSITKVIGEDDWWWLNYTTTIRLRSRPTMKMSFRINFYTGRELRCVVQPTVTVTVKLDDEYKHQDMNYNYDVSQSSILQMDATKTEYGTKYEANTCSASCCQNNQRKGRNNKPSDPALVRQMLMRNKEL